MTKARHQRAEVGERQFAPAADLQPFSHGVHGVPCPTFPPDKAASVIEQQVDLAHQTILEKIESLDPATAATLDQRHSLGNLFD
jgi:hypothetical protein